MLVRTKIFHIISVVHAFLLLFPFTVLEGKKGGDKNTVLLVDDCYLML